MNWIIKITKEMKKIVYECRRIFISVSSSAELKLDAFIFSKHKDPQIRALISGTGLYVTLSLDCMNDDQSILDRFSASDREIIKKIIEEKSKLVTSLMQGNKIEILSKSVDRMTKKIVLKIAISDQHKNNIEIEVDPNELARNKFLLQLFDSSDSFNIGYSAAESRIRSEREEILSAKNSIVQS